MVKVGSMLQSPPKYSAAILNSPKINHRFKCKIIERVRNICPISTFQTFFLAFKCQKNGVDSAAGINVLNSFYDFESE